MLDKIKIENYRCYDEHEIELRNFSIVVGKNNAGKSTLIEALRLVSLATSRFGSVSYQSHPSWLDLPLIAKGITPSLKSFGFNTENLFHNYGDAPSVITATFSSKLIVTVYIGNNAELFCTLQNNRSEYVITKGAANLLNIPQVNILPQIGLIEKEETILGRDYIRQNLATDLASRHFRNQLALLYESYPKFTELAEQSWSGLRIRTFDGRNGQQGSNDKLSLLIQDGSFVSEVGWMGSGLQMWLQIMWFLSRVNENEIIILDEPDVYMHPDLQRKLIRLLRSRYKYVIVSTHSIEIISEVEPNNILIIDKQKSKSVYANKVPVVQGILNSIGSIHNLQLTKLWASKKLLIVEGEDIAILKRLQNVLYPNTNETFDSIPNFDIGGWGGWNHAKGSSMLLKETVDYNVNIYCLFDSDYHTETEVSARLAEAKKVKVNIHIWAKKEIENYLIIPTTILRILKEESKKASHLTVADIENVISEKAKEMEDDLIDKLADGIQKEDRKHGISSARRLAKSRIDSLNNRVCGKDLISILSSWTQDNFKVSLSPIKLASNLQVNEIDLEVKKVIGGIEECVSF
ncbi:ATP-dependent nuclease [Rurimicrobium arvi]|uniref:ATP-binding protein n=1 Tax=Rurimicrobium arvi TaxID=2049916 RepID=A0ABP8MZM8_9BACT